MSNGMSIIPRGWQYKETNYNLTRIRFLTEFTVQARVHDTIAQ